MTVRTLAIISTTVALTVIGINVYLIVQIYLIVQG